MRRYPELGGGVCPAGASAFSLEDALCGSRCWFPFCALRDVEQEANCLPIIEGVPARARYSSRGGRQPRLVSLLRPWVLIAYCALAIFTCMLAVAAHCVHVLVSH